MCKIRRLRACPVNPLDVLCVLFRFETESNNLLSACNYGEDSRFGLKPPHPDPVWLHKSLIQRSTEWHHSSWLKSF